MNQVYAEEAGAYAPPPPNEVFNGLFGHLTPHTFFSFDLFGLTWNFTNHTATLLMGGFLVWLLFWGAHGRRRELRAGAVPKGRWPNFAEALVLFIRDEMVYDAMGREVGRKFAPLFLTQFFFIWFVNVLGNVPIPKIGGAPTANIAVTGALAITTLTVMIGFGIKASGPIGVWKSLVPHGLPPVIREILFIVELAGFLIIKPGALTIRLFANIFGGHLVLLSLFGIVYVFGSWAIFGAVLPMALFVAILEQLVAVLQAFIFTILSIMFVQMSIHPEH